MTGASPKSRALDYAPHRRGATRRLVQLCGVEVRPHNPSLLPELARHFERSGFRVQQLKDVIKVQRPDAPDNKQVAREIRLHLAVWQAMHPDSIKTPSHS